MGSLCSRIIGSDSRNVNVGYTLLYIAYIAYIAYTLFLKTLYPLRGNGLKAIFGPSTVTTFGGQLYPFLGVNCTHFWGSTVPIFGGQLLSLWVHFSGEALK